MNTVLASVTPSADYNWLTGMVASWLHRTDLAAQIPNFIVMAEMRIKTLLEPRIHEAVSVIETVPGAASVALPDLLLHTRSLSIPNVAPALEYVTPDQYNQQYDTGQSGQPRYYTTVGNVAYFGPTPDAVYAVTCNYRAEALALSEANPTNTLLATWPNVYLFGTLVEAADWSGDDASLLKWQAKFQAAIAAINAQDWHFAGPMCVRSDVRSV